MRKWWGLASIGVVVAASIQACVGDPPASDTSDSGTTGSDATTGDGSAGGDGSTGTDSSTGDGGADSGPIIPASCVSQAATCGSLLNIDCCRSSFVDGGTFLRNYDGLGDASPLYTDPNHSATLSSFKLDDFAVTVGRFRKFVDGYPGDVPTTNGVGKNPHNGTDPGWSTTFNTAMPADAPTLKSALVACAPSETTWTDTPDGGPEHRPINCVTWYEAYAFCIWDGARLPTSAEYNYAQSAGSEQRDLPWSSPPFSQSIDGTKIVEARSATAGPLDVGSVMLGNGKFGQSDLMGNMAQWVLDTSTGSVDQPPSSCDNCAVFGGGANVIRGSSYFESGGFERNGRTQAVAPTNRSYAYGFRCARDL